jgi:Zn-finger protein
LFCYCPLYCLGDKCGGNFHYTEKGVKSCKDCLRPHIRENYDEIVANIMNVL